MHIKKRAEDDIKKTIHDLVSPEAKVKVNTSGSGCSWKSKPNKRKIYSWVKNIIAVASGKGGVGNLQLLQT
jgi:ATP-binding protein involved in chromosome partitioning